MMRRLNALLQVQSEYGLEPDDIRSELEQIEDIQRHLEEQGRSLEEAIRTANGDADAEDLLLSQLLETIDEKNKLVRREAELVFM